MKGDAMSRAAGFIASFFLLFVSLGDVRVVGCGGVGGEGELVLVHALWRHGDRSPTGTYKNDPHKADAWPQGFGQLTTLGMAQQMSLGQRLRREYIDRRKLISPEYHAREIYVRSTDTDRTLASAVANFIGFYTVARADVDYPKQPPEGMTWPGQYVPVAIHSQARIQNDHWGNPDADCPRQAAIRELWMKTPEYQKLAADKKRLLQYYLTPVAGQNIGLLETVMLSDVLKIERIWNKTLPTWATPDVIKEVGEVKDTMWNWMFGLGMAPYHGFDFQMELTKIRGGTMLWTILHNMQSKITCLSKQQSSVGGSAKNSQRSSRLEATNPEPPRKVDPNCAEALDKKYFAYSAHDSSISALLSAMRLNKTSFESASGLGYPGYATAVIFELYKGLKSDDDYYIRVKYWPFDAIGIDLTTMIPGCGRARCDYQTFFNTTSSYLPPDSIGIVKHCNNTVLFPNGEPGGGTTN